jgi:two-component system, chemotaxis family, protein-glutamate methylesterase/glutaminase
VIRVLIVDDSVTARQAIAAILRSEPEITIVGEARDGLEGVELAASLKPDVITMDIQMPRMDGNAATQQIMASNPTPIVVVSSVTQQEMVHQGFDILLSGALDIVQKPSALSDQTFASIQAELVAKVKAVAPIKFNRRS